MTDTGTDKHRAWEETQLQWDDTDFLAKTASALMKKKWRRLNRKVLEIISAEVVGSTEYPDLLDIGAGRGDFYDMARDMVRGYTGIEPSHQMLKEDVKSDNYILKRGTGEDLADENMYGVCLIKEVLDHSYDPEKVIMNSYRALKEGGIIIVTLTNKDAFYKLIFKNYAKKLEIEHRDHLYNFCPSEIEALFKKAGFSREKTYSFNYIKMPKLLENIFVSLPEKFVFWFMDVFDALMSVMLPGKGGGFIAVARKGKKAGQI
jgi:SAM-dependent methyltransferase